MIRAAALALLFALPASAQESDKQQGIDLMQEGARLLFRGLMQDMQPAIEQMEQFARIIEDLDAYHPPEILPNGDVILRRKVPLVPAPDAEVDL
jgi:hypothetical protein